jgi:hypothetical protein
MKKSFYCLFLIVVIMVACKSNSGDNKVRIENKLNKNIVCVLGYNYPDLNLAFINKQVIVGDMGRFQVLKGQTRIIDTIGLCDKEVWDKTIKHNMLMLFTFDAEKLKAGDKLEDALLERYYFSYVQLTKTNGLITID